MTHTRCAPSKSAKRAATSSGGGASSSSAPPAVDAALVRTRTRGLASYRVNISSLKTRRGTLRSTGSCDVLRRRSTRRVDATDRLASARSGADAADASSSGAAGAAKSPYTRRRRGRARGGGEKKVRVGERRSRGLSARVAGRRDDASRLAPLCTCGRSGRCTPRRSDPSPPSSREAGRARGGLSFQPRSHEATTSGNNCQ